MQNVWGPGGGFEIELVALDFGLPFETVEYGGGCRIDCLDDLDSVLATCPYPQGKPLLAQGTLTGIEIHGNEMPLDALAEPTPQASLYPYHLGDRHFQF